MAKKQIYLNENDIKNAVNNAVKAYLKEDLLDSMSLFLGSIPSFDGKSLLSAIFQTNPEDEEKYAQDLQNILGQYNNVPDMDLKPTQAIPSQGAVAQVRGGNANIKRPVSVVAESFVRLKDNGMLYFPQPKGLDTAKRFVLYGEYIAQRETEKNGAAVYHAFNTPDGNHQCSTGAFEVLGVLLQHDFPLHDLDINANAAWEKLQKWGTHYPFAGGNGQNGHAVNAIDPKSGKFFGTNVTYVPQVGDVAISDYHPGHMAVYLGDIREGYPWVSDFIQQTYNGDLAKKPKNVYIYRLKKNKK